MGFFQYGQIVEQLRTVATAGGTTTLVNNDKQNQIFTGSLAQTVKLPDVTTMTVGQFFNIFNQSTGSLTLEFHDGSNFTDASGKSYVNVPSSSSITLTLQTNSGSSPQNGTWAVTATASSGVSAWVASTPYLTNNVVIYQQDAYVAQSNFTSGASFEADVLNGNWTLLNNPITNPNLLLVGNNFEDGDAGSWTAIGVASLTNGIPTSVGSGGNAFSASNGGRAKGSNTTAPAVTSSFPIDGQYSLNLATSGAGTIGDGYISQPFSIASKYQAKSLTFNFSYKVASGTPNMSGTSSNTYAVAIYDVINNAWLGAAGIFNFVQSSGVGTCSGTFQTSSTTTTLQLFIYSPVAPTGASSLLIDDIYVGAQVTPTGPAMTDWVSYPMVITGATTNPTKATTTTYDNAYYRRVGDSMEIRYDYRGGSSGASAGSGAYLFSIPSGYSIDNTKLENSTGGFNSTANGVVGVCSVYPGVTSGFTAVYDSQHLSMVVINTGSPTTVTVGSAAYPITGGDTRYSFTALVPIVGWSSNTSMSSDTDTRVVAFVSNGNPSGTPSASRTQVIFPSGSIAKDTHSAYNTSTGLYIAPVSGYYNISANLDSSGTGTQTILQKGELTIGNQTTSVGSSYASAVICVTTQTELQVAASVTVYANAGDSLGLQYSTGQSGTLSWAGGIGSNNLSIFRLSGPAVIAATETVAAIYFVTSASTTIPNITATNIPNLTKTLDTHNAMNTSTATYTAPVSGTYSFSVQLDIAGFTINTGEIGIQINKNGSVYTQNYSSIGAATQEGHIITGLVHMLAGDTLNAQYYQSNGGARTLSDATGGGGNFFHISRIGN